MKVITAAVIKGGAGKTTTCTALAQAAAADGKRVLAIDLDPQGNFSFFIGADQTAPGSAKRLQRALEPLKKKYDLVFIDTPPQMGELTFNALQASTGLIIPLETDHGSLQGLFRIVDIAHQMQRHNAGLTIYGVILTRYDNRPRLNRYLRDAIRDQGEDIGAPLLMEIRAGIAVKEAQAMQ